MSDDPQIYIFRLLSLVIAITFHEFAHARTALAFGDDTAEREGRVSLNPLVHLDPIGSIGMIFGTFGWGRPVPVNSNRMRHPRADFMVAAAGPMSNISMAILAAVVFRLVVPAGVGPLATFLAVLIHLNLSLALFNFIPLFPLDGSHMAENLLRGEPAHAFRRFNESYGMPVLFSLILMGMMSSFSPLALILGPPLRFLFHLLVLS